MRIVFSEPAQRQLEKLDQAAQRRILGTLEKLLQHPSSSDLKKLKGMVNCHRLRVGDYRVILEIHENELVILVLKIGHRKEIYR